MTCGRYSFAGLVVCLTLVATPNHGIGQALGVASGAGGSSPSVPGVQVPVAPLSATGVGASGVRRFEIGGQFTDTKLGQCNYQECLSEVQYAMGSGIALNLNRHLALEGLYNVMLGFQTPGVDYSTGGRGSELLFGVRAEARAKRYGLIAFARPGVVHWNALSTGYLTVPGSLYQMFNFTEKTYFASELGGGVEYYPSARVHVRAEMGDLLISRSRYCGNCAAWTNNVQTSVGVYAGIGKMLGKGTFDVGREPAHRFFDKTNVLLMTVSVLGQSADMITTQRFRSHGIQEGDPLARPLVDRGWAGQIGLAVIYNAAEIATMYGLHKMGHHTVERLLPIVPAAEGGYRGYNNLQPF
jgi:hypothetical protein